MTLTRLDMHGSLKNTIKRALPLGAFLVLSACNLTIGTSNVAFSTSTQPVYGGQSPSEQDGLVRCPYNPGKFVKPGFEDALCRD